MDLRRLRLGEWLAGGFGAALLAVMFADWYGSPARDAWQAFGVLDVVLALTGLMAIALAVLTAMHRSQAVPMALGALLLLLGLVASVWLVVRVLDPPGSAGARESGLWLGLAACVGATAAGLMSLRDDSFPRAVREQNRVEVETLPTPPRR